MNTPHTENNPDAPGGENHPEEHDEIVEQGEPHEGHTAAEDLAEADDDLVEVDESLPPKKRAKIIRKMSDDELLKLADEAAKSNHWLEVAKRAQAEMDNTIKRLKREQSDAVRFAQSGLARDLLQVVDNLERALQAAAKNQDFKALHDGIKMTTQGMMDALARHDIKPIEAEGKPFDPSLHEALLTTQRDDLDNNVVAAELERGWMLHDRVLRATKVQVNKLEG
jgi:molecular chaperone GrpE